VLLAESCLCQHPDATVLHVHRCMADYLKLAPYRLGGAGKGCRHPDLETVLAEADNSHGNSDADANVVEDDDDDGERTQDEDTHGDGMESNDDADGEGTEDEGTVAEGKDTDGQVRQCLHFWRLRPSLGRPLAPSLTPWPKIFAALYTT